MTARESSENGISDICHNCSIVPSHYACKMSSRYPGIKLASAIWRLGKTWKFLVKRLSSTQLHKSPFLHRWWDEKGCEIYRNETRPRKVITIVSPSSPWLLPDTAGHRLVQPKKRHQTNEKCHVPQQRKKETERNGTKRKWSIFFLGFTSWNNVFLIWVHSLWAPLPFFFTAFTKFPEIFTARTVENCEQGICPPKQN